MKGAFVGGLFNNYRETGSEDGEVDVTNTTLNDNNDDMSSQTQQEAIIPTVDKKPKVRLGDLKKYKIQGMVAGGIIAIVIAFFVWNTFFNFIEVDIFEHLTVVYYGVDGIGTVQTRVVPNEFLDERIQEFLATIKYSTDKYYKLSDGDIIVISAEYDKELMKENKIKVNEFQKEYIVEGLNKIPKTVNEIEGYESMQTELRNRIRILCDEEYLSDSSSYTLSEETFFYGDTEEYSQSRTYYYGTLAVVYKLTYKEQSISDVGVGYIMYAYTGIIKNGKTGVFEEGKYSFRLVRLSRNTLPAIEIDLENNYKLKKVN